jgi:hypothetical protein
VGSRNDAPGCGLTMMKVNENTSVKTLFPIVAMVLIGTTYATSAKSQPFIPDNRPRCSLAIMRGAQQAYDAYINSIKRKHDKEELYESTELEKFYNNELLKMYNNLPLESYEKVKERIYKHMEQSKESRKKLNQNELEVLAYKKLDEFEKYAAKKYKCVLVILEYIP